MDMHEGLMARDALDAAVVEARDQNAICSYDLDFDSLEGFRRIPPPAR